MLRARELRTLEQNGSGAVDQRETALQGAERGEDESEWGMNRCTTCNSWGRPETLQFRSRTEMVRLWRAPSWEEIAAAEAKEKTEIKQP